MRYDEGSVRDNYKKLTEFLISKEISITTMESATSGQIASLITDTQGASAIFKGAYITYSNEAKIMQGVPRETIDTYSVYSKETAAAMAACCKAAFAADIGIGVTGTMGNIDPANKKASTPGRVYFAIAIHNDTYCFQTNIPPQAMRLSYKLAVADEIYKKLAKLLNFDE